MSNSCLHCAIWETIIRHARKMLREDETTGKIVGRQDEIAFRLTEVLVDVMRTIPTRAGREALRASVGRAINPVVDEPFVIQPRPEMEVVSWQ